MGFCCLIYLNFGMVEKGFYNGSRMFLFFQVFHHTFALVREIICNILTCRLQVTNEAPAAIGEYPVFI